MNEKLAQVGNIQEKFSNLENEKDQLKSALIESSQNNRKLKEILNEKDSVIQRIQTELENFVKIKNELAPIFKESVELKRSIVGKDSEINELKSKLLQTTAIIEELPNIESYVKQAASTIKLIGEENHSLKTQVMSTHLAGGLEQGQ